ncbi:MAG: ATP synthase F0 subunit B [Candidatus Electrothrix sp. AUS4]|nr:ATP synthase F0 subunit B [Candidatus Electrothrix sp. AUS4]
MKARSLKKFIPILFAVGLCGMAFVPSYAQEHGEEGHPVEQAAVHEQQGEHHVAESPVVESHSDHEALEMHGEHAAAGHEEAHGEHHAPMLTAAKLKDLLWRTLNFAALVFILVKFLARPLSVWLGDRRYRIQEELENMQRQRDEAEKAYQSFESRLAGMEGEMADLVARAKAMAEDEKARIITEAEVAAENIRQQAESAVQGALAQATRRLQADIAEQAVVLAEELILQNLTPEDQVAITEKYLERVGAVQ